MPCSREDSAGKSMTRSDTKKECLAEKRPSSKGHFKPVNCNLDSFLESTCPSVRVNHLPKSCQWETCRKRPQDGNVENLPFFVLGDLWDSLDEWSAYGAGVPITLKGQEVVVQFYVPYLSALQLYTRSMKRPNIQCSSYRAPSGHESDCGSVSSSDVDDTGVPDCRNCQCGMLSNMGHHATTCCGCDKLAKLDLCCNSEDKSSNTNSLQHREWHRHLRFEYFESSPPYSRVPLSEKIAQIGASAPELKTLRSVDLLPASWMSIAWYPIYRIPTGPTLQDLEACFLTFHSLSTSLEDGEPSGIVKPSSRPTACAASRSTDTQWEYTSIHLEAFGLAHYKLRGSIWTSVGNPERRHAASLYRCAESWLHQLRVQHPDFNFFRAHNPTS